jgi:hypothetical protein
MDDGWYVVGWCVILLGLVVVLILGLVFLLS